MFSIYFILKNHIKEMKSASYQKKLIKKTIKLDYEIQKLVISYHRFKRNTNMSLIPATVCITNIISEYRKLKNNHIIELNRVEDLIEDIYFIRKEFLTVKMKL